MNPFISFLQAFGILLVVIGHSFYGCQNNSCVYTWLYSFHMPLFMFISGYLLKYGINIKKINLADVQLSGLNGFLNKKAKRLLIPYVIISSIVFFPKGLLNSFAMRPVDVSFEHYLNMLIYPWDNVIVFFWFLPTLFIIFSIVVCVARLKLHVHPLIVCLLLLLFHLFNPLGEVKLLNIGGVVGYMFYFVLGYYYCKSQYVINAHTKLFFFITLSLSILYLNISDFTGKDVLMAINGIAMSIFLAKIYNTAKWTFLNHMYGASYAIYLLSWFPQVVSQQIFLKLTHAPWLISTLLAILSRIYIPLLVYRWMIKNKKKKIGQFVAVLMGH